MKVYRILVDSSQRTTGHAFDFTYDVSRITTSRDFIGKSWMAAVEWCDPVKYSEHTGVFAKHINHPSCLLLTCPTLQQHNTHESWTGNVSSTLAMLQSYVSYGYYGMSADAPYVGRKSLGCYIQGDRLNQAGTLQFRMMQGPSVNDASVRPCKEPDGATVFGEHYSFSLVFWEIKTPKPEKPISPYYDFYKLYLNSSDRLSGTPADCTIPVHFSASGSMGVGTWQVAIDAVSIVKHDVQASNLAQGLAVISDTFRDPYGHRVLGHLSRSYRNSEEGWYGLKLTNKPVSRDTVGTTVTNSLDGVSTVHIGIRDSVGLAAVSGLHEWIMAIAFYRID